MKNKVLSNQVLKLLLLTNNTPNNDLIENNNSKRLLAFFYPRTQTLSSLNYQIHLKAI